MPDANTIRLFHQKLTEARALQVQFDAFDYRLRTSGYLAMAESRPGFWWPAWQAFDCHFAGFGGDAL